jgi:LacI family transcriptional regulator
VSKPRQPTIKDVARLAGVSKTTVGRVVNGEDQRVAEKTRVRVLAAIEMLGYERNIVASSLRTDQTLMVALSIPDIMNPFWPEVARGVQDTCEAQGYTVALLNSDWDTGRELVHLQTVRRNRFDGLVLNPIRITNAELRSLNTPTVLLGSDDDYPDFDSVGSDSVGAVNTALEHLIALGHRRIGLIAGISQRSRPDTRYHCYIAMHQHHHLPLDLGLVIRCPYSQAEGAAAMRQLLSQAPPPTAVLAGNDLLAIGALIAAKQAGLRIPDDLSIIGIDDIDASSTTSPPLTTVAKPKYDIGVRAATLLLERMRGDQPPTPRKVLLQGQLQVRETTRPPG